MAQERLTLDRSLNTRLAAAVLLTAVILTAVILTAGCGSPAGTPTTTMTSTSTSTGTTSQRGTVTGSMNPHLESLVDVAVADLVGRLHVDPAGVAVVSARSMEWPDRSMGCPQPGMAYPQTPVDGALIVLSVGGTVYRYHSGGSRGPFLCENDTP